ncbi:CaiB/BaiF CoA transferase family protein [Brevundimonas sp.]|uniref:CaiB/BaiF CoA transferase family protein n=1 Tax=Brevundimonas sp. TaxID=1871086 RepID=UPI002FC76E9B
MNGPLSGIRIIEIAGLGPAPFAAMMLADHGAEVIRIDRPGAHIESRDPLMRSRTIRFLDLKSPDGQAALRELVKTADGLIEGFRPGVMERLGLGPDVLLTDNPALVYGRMTGWGQSGFYAARAGHDINYIAASGALHMIGRKGEAPVPPLNLVGDFGGGGMMLAFGMVSALLAVKNGASGQVIDCAMTDGSALLTAMMWGFRASGFWQDERGSNILDTAAAFYDVYETADGKHIAIGAIEPQFYALMLHGTGLSDDPLFAIQMDIANWPAQKAALAARIRTKTRDEWAAIFDGLDACVTPVLNMTEALAAPHNRDRNTFITIDGVDQPAPAPRYSATPCATPVPPKT